MSIEEIGENVETSTVLNDMQRRVVKNFLDVLVLTELRYGRLSGYDVIEFVHDRFGILVSSGTVYSLLYALERDGLIVGEWNQRKRVYRLTAKGDGTIRAIMIANDKIPFIVSNVLRAQR